MSDDLDDLFRRYHQELHRFARRRLGEPDMAADVVQDAFLRYAVMAGPGGAGQAQAVRNPKFFLFRIVSNLIIDLTRQRARRGTETGHGAMIDAHPDATPSPERMAMGRQDLARLAQAIDGLPPRCREVFVLARIEGLKYPEIGARLGISPKTVYSHLVRSLALIKIAMNADSESDL